MHVVVVAYACRPGGGSEPGAGWNMARSAASLARVTVITRSKYVSAVEAEVARQLLPMRVVGLEVGGPIARFKKGRRGIHLYYSLWLRRAAREVLKLHQEEGIDLVHHVTLAADWLPIIRSRKFPEVPLVWGPVGGATPYPYRQMLRWLTPRDVLKEVLRNVVTALGRSRNKRRIAASGSRRPPLVVVALNRDTERALGADFVSCNAVLEPAKTRAGRENGRFLFVGRLDAWKGVDLAVATMADPRLSTCTLTICGTGSRADTRRVAQRVARLRLQDRVELLGHVSSSDVRAELNRAAVLLFPSVHDSAPLAVAEAQAAGVPVVALNRGGPRDMINATGLGLTVAFDAAVTSHLAEALLEVQTKPYSPTDFWSSERTVGRVELWYQQAVLGGHE